MSYWGQGGNRKNRTRKLKNRASIYADVNAQRPRDYWNYEALTIQWGYVRTFKLFQSSLNIKYVVLLMIMKL